MRKKRPVQPVKSPQELSASLLAYSRMAVPDLLKEFESSENGLTAAAVRRKHRSYGFNEVAHEKPPSGPLLFLRNFKNPFVILLIVLGAVSYFIGEKSAVVIIGVMVLLGVMMRFIQEYRSNLAAEKLKKMVSTKATVKRLSESSSKPVLHEIDIKYLVPGDIVHLSAGDLIPADLRIISSKELYVGQSALTGEPLPVEKGSEGREGITDPMEMPNLCFMGTNVLNGSGTGIILHAGHETYFGSMARKALAARPPTSFDIGVNRVSWLLIRFMVVMVPIVFLINFFTKGGLLETTLFSLSIAVGLTPEMLPMIVTANLAKGAVNMSRSKVIVKQLNAIQNFGAMDLLCTDKTGTLTLDKIILEKYLNSGGDESDEVLTYGFLNSYHQTSLKSLLDAAVLKHRDLEKELQLDAAYRKIDEVPFDFERRRMSVVVEKNGGEELLICKGAFEETLSVCSHFKSGERVLPLSDEERARLKGMEVDLNEDGLRVLAVAYKEEKEKRVVYSTKDEVDLIFLGFLAFLDPPKESANHALKLLQEHNVQVKVLTGDNERVTQRICRWVGLQVEGLLRGVEIDKMGDEELKRAVVGTTIFTKLNPFQKARVIRAFKANGHIVGYLADGINDALALRDADIGISVDTAVDIAKEFSDIVMLEKSLLFLGKGVVEGRRTFGNIIKYIKMATSSNFGNVFSVLGASALFPFLPMLPIQLLTQNLLYDFSQTAIPFDRVDRDFILQPQKWSPGGIAKFMVFIGPISSIFDYMTFAVLWFIFGANSIAHQALFQTGWFVEGLLSQTLIVHMIRTRQIPFIQSIASPQLLLTTLVIMAVGIYLPYSAIGHSIGFVSLPASYFSWLTGILAGYCFLTQVVKFWFIRRFRYWL